MIGMIILAVIAVLIFFGVTAGFFEKTGIANWVAFLIVLAFAVAAVFPPLVAGSGVSFSYAGFFMPLLLGVVTLFALGANASLVRALVGAMAVAGITIAARVALPATDGYRNTAISVAIVGAIGGIVAFVIARSRLATMSAVFCGVVIGDFATAMLYRFVIDGEGLLALGQNGIFDSLIAALFVGAITLEISALVARAAVARKRAVPIGALAQTEAGEDNLINESESVGRTKEEDDLFDDYFNDDID